MRSLLLHSNMAMAAYAKKGDLRSARKLFDGMRHRDAIAWNTIVSAYAKHGDFQEVRHLFGLMPTRNVISWTAMITAYAKSGHCKEAMETFHNMRLEGVSPDRIVFISALDACSKPEILTHGRFLHCCIESFGSQSDVILETAMIDMYGKCGSLMNAQAVFMKMGIRSKVAWNAMINAYVHNGHTKMAQELLVRMDWECEGGGPDKYTWSSILNGCMDLGYGKSVHARVISRGMGGSDLGEFVATALVKMYGGCGLTKEARSVFDKMDSPDKVAWSAMLSVYARNGEGGEALEVYRWMFRAGVRPDKVTFISALDACAGSANISQGRLIHDCIARSGCEPDTAVDNALIDMYGKCGSPSEARNSFDQMSLRDVISWNVMIAAYAQNGEAENALELFQRMGLDDDVKPDKITFINILSACSHKGLLDYGWHCFISMHASYGIVPSPDHYLCVIDLLGRAGRLDKAERLIRAMPLETPFDSQTSAWMRLLGACRIHEDVDRGAHAAEHLAVLLSA